MISRALLPTMLVLMFSVFGCEEAPKESEPQRVAKAFLTAVEAWNWAAADTLCTESTRKDLEQIKTFSRAAGHRGVTIVGETMDGEDVALVTYKIGQDEKEYEISCVKKDGKWLVETTKSQLVPDSDFANFQKELQEGFGASTTRLGEVAKERGDSVGGDSTR